MKEYELINRRNPLTGIEVGKEINGRKIIEVLEPVIVIQRLTKRKKYFIVVKCKCGREDKIELRSMTSGHECPACVARERQNNVKWKYNPVF